MKIKIVWKFSGLLYNVLKRSMKLCTLWRACDYVCAQAWRPRRRNTYTLLEKECAVYRNISRTRYRCGPAVCAAAYLISYNLRYGGTRGAATCRTTATARGIRINCNPRINTVMPRRPPRPEPGQISRSTISVIFCTLVSSDSRCGIWSRVALTRVQFVRAHDKCYYERTVLSNRCLSQNNCKKFRETSGLYHIAMFHYWPRSSFRYLNRKPQTANLKLFRYTANVTIL